MTKEKLIKNILEIESHQKAWRQKCRRNLILYEFTPNMDLTSQNDSTTVGFYNAGNAENTSMIQENVIRSCIDTLGSKIASQKVTPFFNTVNGTFREIQVVKAAQQFFDILYDELNVNKTVVQAFVDSCITDRGIIYVNKDNKNIERIQPWQFFFDPREYAYGQLTHCAFKKTDYPASLLTEKTDLQTVTLHEYWSIKEHIHATYIEELNKVSFDKWDANILPFAILRWSNPVKASSSTCVVDLLFGIQKQINYLLSQIKDASKSSFGIKYIVPTDSDVKINRLNNSNGEVIEYTPQMTPNGVMPVQPVTPAFMDGQWFSALQQFKQDAYEMVGISQLSAMSQKPSGLNTGIGLQTMEDIESDRFETQLNSVIRVYVDIAKICMEVFDPLEEVLPSSIYRGHITWKDITEARNLMSIQFSSLDKISKDPVVKQQIISQWVNSGYISRAHAMQLLEVPDDTRGYSLMNNSLNAVMSVIDDCVEKDIYDVPIYIDTALLKEEITSTLLSLKAAQNPENEVDIQKLQRLMYNVEAMNKNAMTSAEFAATQSLQEELTAAIPGIQQQAIQEGSKLGLDAAIQQQQTEQAQQNEQQQENMATSDINEKESVDNGNEAAQELLSLGKKFYKNNKKEKR